MNFNGLGDYCQNPSSSAMITFPLTVEGWETGREGRIRTRQGEIRNSAGKVLARGTGRFVEVDPQKFRASLPAAPTQ